MLLNPLNSILKRRVIASGHVSRINHMSHDLGVGLFLVGVDGFDFEVERLSSEFKDFMVGGYYSYQGAMDATKTQIKYLYDQEKEKVSMKKNVNKKICFTPY
jgi:hypothetical protein